MTVNATIPEPVLPRWASEDRCERCGALYADFTAGVTFEDGCRRVRRANPDGGGWRSRGPVLWAMHVLKLEAWVEAHVGCEPAPEPCEGCETFCPWCEHENGRS